MDGSVDVGCSGSEGPSIEEGGRLGAARAWRENGLLLLIGTESLSRLMKMLWN